MAREERFAEVADEAAWGAVVAIRQRVFVEEQDCPPEEEFDVYDESATHVLAYVDDTPVATARWRATQHGGTQVAKLERFAVLPEHRGGGLGRRLVAHVMSEARRAGHRRYLLHAQAHLEDFYGSLGFHAEGDEFEEAGIPHLRMVAKA
ncbi:MAG: GNAT family N-acetyltransferase [Acidobacteriota bacterium]